MNFYIRYGKEETKMALLYLYSWSITYFNKVVFDDFDERKIFDTTFVPIDFIFFGLTLSISNFNEINAERLECKNRTLISFYYYDYHISCRRFRVFIFPRHNYIFIVRYKCIKDNLYILKLNFFRL